MKVNTKTSPDHRQLLTYCLVSNNRGETSPRFIDHSQFGLWQFLLQRKHGLRISRSTPCVWVPEDQCQRQPGRWLHTAFSEPVSRVEYSTYDAQTGITARRLRFVATAELENVASILRRHFGADIDDLRISAGTAISTLPA